MLHRPLEVGFWNHNVVVDDTVEEVLVGDAEELSCLLLFCVLIGCCYSEFADERGFSLEIWRVREVVELVLSHVGTSVVRRCALDFSRLICLLWLCVVDGYEGADEVVQFLTSFELFACKSVVLNEFHALLVALFTH